MDDEERLINILDLEIELESWSSRAHSLLSQAKLQSRCNAGAARGPETQQRMLAARALL